MTCVLGYTASDGSVVMGCDSAVSYYGDRMLAVGPKFGVWPVRNGNRDVIGPLAVGVSGDGRVVQHLLSNWSPPTYKQDASVSWDGYYPSVVAHEIADDIRGLPYSDCFKHEQGGYDGSFLVAWHRQLFIVCSNLCIVRTNLPYQGIGSGSEYGLGALRMTEMLNGPAEDAEEAHRRLTAALTISAEASNSVAGPFHLQTLE